MASLLDLPPEALHEIAARLLDERDAAALRASCRALRAAYADDALWARLIAARFGAGAGAEVGLELGARLRGAAGPAEAKFRGLSALGRAVAGVAVTWLQGRAPEWHQGYLRVEPPPAELGPPRARGGAVRVRSVCWLEMAATFEGVLPGRYVAPWRVGAAACLHNPTCVVPPLRLSVTARPAGRPDGAGAGAEVLLPRRPASDAPVRPWYDARLPFTVPEAAPGEGAAHVVEARLWNTGGGHHAGTTRASGSAAVLGRGATTTSSGSSVSSARAGPSSSCGPTPGPRAGSWSRTSCTTPRRFWFDDVRLVRLP
jgi:hypothetical protein